MTSHRNTARTPRRPSSLAARLALAACLLGAGVAVPAHAQDFSEDKFRQLEELLPTPGTYRAASGAPGPDYWQQRADYVIDVELDDERQRLTGSETVTYHNRSPLPLSYLWMQLDANIFEPGSDAHLVQTAPDLSSRFPFRRLAGLLHRETFEGGFDIRSVHDASGAPLPFTIVKTMMRIDLPQPLASGASATFGVDWSYRLNEHRMVRGRAGWEYFEEDENYLYEVAQWFPRMAAYTDVNGWQHKQFLGSGEFTLELGDYFVRITAPADHVVASTGELQNPGEVLSATQRERLEEAKHAARPVFVITPEEAQANEASRSTEKKTWIFRAENVRDFAFASSRKFIWDAIWHPVAGAGRAWCMSYYPNEGEPLWSRYSTQAIMHTLDVYSRYTFPYPYPVAISVNGPVGGMEYPMICFNGPRPEEDGTYSKRTKFGLIGVVIHEVGHNYFPMIVNSDERQWTWMDEGVNSFVQYLAEVEWEDDYPHWSGEPKGIVGYMKSSNQVPIMTNSESILQFGNNAYDKPATALNILRETILGRELFDFAFKEYARRWMFKRPMPADLFRTLEDASAVDLDWFWRGWFYTTDACDIGIESVTEAVLDRGDPEVDKARRREERDVESLSLSDRRNAVLEKRIEAFGELKDFYNEYDELDVTDADRERFAATLEKLDDDQRELLELERHFTIVEFANHGGLVMPILLELEFDDGAVEELRIPAEVWRRNSKRVKKLLMTEREIVRIEVDPHLETADVDRGNNHWPPRAEKSRFRLFKSRGRGSSNPMQKALQARREAEEELEEAAEQEVAEESVEEAEAEDAGEGEGGARGRSSASGSTGAGEGAGTRGPGAEDSDG